MRDNIGLYRAKREDNGEWVEGFYSEFWVEGKKSHQIYVCPKEWKEENENSKLRNHLLNGGEWFVIDPETIGQYTGDDDDNKTKIFSGDIIQYDTDNGFYQGCVAYGKNIKEEGAFNSFYMENIIEIDEDTNEEYAKMLEDGGYIGAKIIGNIHDNPELLKESE